jgi:alkylated DNA repair dioxygenase AlkB
MNELFTLKPISNLLPFDGIVEYYGVIIDTKKSDSYFLKLLTEIPWQNDTAVVFGKHITTKRKVAWYGDGDFVYNYSGTTRDSLSWTPMLLELKNLIESKTSHTYNSVLLNLYHNGAEGMGWHHDEEKGLGKNANIASLSFGAERRFDLRHNTSKITKQIVLPHGSLLVMKGETQSCWKHQLPKQLKILQPRINLTFRTFTTPDKR